MPPTVPLVGVVVAEGQAMPPALDALDGRARLELVRTPAEMGDILARADALVVYDFRTRLLHEADWSRARNIAWVHAASAGVDAVLAPAVVDRRITVTNSRGVFDRPIAEYVLGVMLMIVKDFRRTLTLQQERQWQHRDARMLRGSRLLVVGTGSIGHEIGELAHAVGMVVEGIARSERRQPPFEQVLASEALRDRLPGADFVAIAAPLTAETRGMFDAATIGVMKPGAWLINVGRGPIVDQDALLRALETGAVAGAALDVFEQEPLPPGHPFWGMEQVFVSPHMSADTEGWVADLSRLFAANFDRWQRGEPLHNVVDTQREAASGAAERRPQ